MNSIYRSYRVISLLCLMLILLAACGEQSSPTGNTATTPGTTSTPVATTVTTAQILPTQTNCPASGTARAAVMPPLSQGTSQCIVYTFLEDNSQKYRTYDPATGTKADILTISGGTTNSTLSADGHWIIFQHGGSVQLLRLDGQELQTLYCQNTLSSPLLSPDQKHLAFAEVDPDAQYLYILDLANGSLHKTLSFPNDKNAGPGNPPGYLPLKWADNQSLYVVKYPTSGIGGRCPFLKLCYRQSVFLVHNVMLDVSQQQNNLLAISLSGVEAGTQQDYDMQGSQQIFFNKATPTNATPPAGASSVLQGPSEIDVQSVSAGSVQPIYKSATQAIIYLNVSDHAILFTVLNEAFDPTNDIVPAATQLPSTKDDGLWAVNLDGSNPRHLVSASPGDSMGFFSLVYTPWSNVSRDGKYYAITGYSPTTQETTLACGPLDGHEHPNVVGSASSRLEIVGWTTA